MKLITVCVCTFHRERLLTKLIEGVARQETGGRFGVALAVVDNGGGSSEGVVRTECARHGLPFAFAVEGERSFAAVRNRVLGLVTGEFVAFIDDDEVPGTDWLLRLFETLHRSGCDGALGPVRPYFEHEPPAWVRRSAVCERPSHPTGTLLHWSQTRTGNVLLRRALFVEGGLRFDPLYASGGEDVDFFKRATAAGYRFVWCEEAPVHELVPPERCRRNYVLRRALLQGSISLRYAPRDRPFARVRLLAKTAFAAVAYGLVLPFTFLRGEHLGMRYLIKECHHLGRLAGFLRLQLPRP